MGDRRTLVLGVCWMLSGAGAVSAPVQANPTGLSPGEFRVNDGGSATYSIAIQVPPGTNGMAPDLSFAYNSQAGNGLLGIGWSLAGISAIERCPRTLAVDGAVGGVGHDAGDRFCLNGERLVSVGTEPYGSAGSRYRLERDDLTSVQALGAVANQRGGFAPERFLVKARDGQILKFGYSPDSRLTLPGKSSVHKWLLTRVEDRHGNYLEIVYDDLVPEHCLPVRIAYTANDAAGQTADHVVLFDYEERPDPLEEYVAGVRLRTTQRLKTVLTQAGGQPVREYRLSYEAAAVATRSRLTSITECGSQGGCKRAHTFEWQNSGALTFKAVIDPVRRGRINGPDGRLHFGDWNGDGRSDFMWYYDVGGKNRWFLSQGNGSFTEVSDPIAPGDINGGGALHFGDWNGDGVTDAMWYYAPTGINRWYVNDGRLNFVRTSDPIPRGDINGGGRMRFGDFNGDGLSDAMWYYSPTGINRWYVNDGRLNFVRSSDPVPRVDIDGGGELHFGDWNGDSLIDFMWYYPAAGINRWYLNRGELRFTRKFDPIARGDIKGNGALRFGDWNGDGLTDAMWHYSATGINRWYVNDGDLKFVRHLDPVSRGLMNGGRQLNFGDWNADGRVDLVIWHSSSGENRWLQNQGDFQFTGTLNPISRPAIDDGGALHVGDWDGNGLADILWYDRSSGAQRVYTNQRAVPDLLTQMTDALGAVARVQYAPITSGSVYTKGSNARYPVIDLQTPRYVVSVHAHSDGTADAMGRPGMYRVAHRYGGAKAHLGGRGSLGFRWHQTQDRQTGIKVMRFFRQAFPYVGSLARSETRLQNGTLIGETRQWYGTKTHTHDSGHRTYVVYTQRTLQKQFELDGGLITAVTTDITADWAGNARRVVVDRGDGYSKTTDTQFLNSKSQWLFGLPTRVEVTHSAPGVPAIKRLTEFAYQHGNGVLTRSVIEPHSNPDVSLTTQYAYDQYGNRTRITVSGPDIAARSSTVKFDPAGRFPVTARNALNHAETRVYDAGCGKITRLTGPNGLTTQWRYDEFCRPVAEYRPDKTQTKTVYEVETPPFSITTQVTGQADRTTYLDRLGRITKTVVAGLWANQPIHRDVVYDVEGRITRESAPYLPDDPIYWTDYAYDAIGRVINVTTPDAHATTTEYRGLTTIVTNPLFQTTTTVNDAAGRLIQVLDNEGNPTDYRYDAVGNLIRTRDAAGNSVFMTYDQRGRKSSLHDPDMGIWRYAYNSLGEIVSQTDARNQTLVMTYDRLGRLASRTTPEGLSSWTYDSAYMGVGKLHKASAPGYVRTHRYDASGRPVATTVNIGGHSLTSTMSYDGAGRVSTVSYPGGFVKIRKIYNPRGYLTRINDARTGALLWRLGRLTARGQVRQEAAGNGLISTRVYDGPTGLIQGIKTGSDGNVQNLRYAFDAFGNLEQRRDINQARTEAFGYDALNRLVFADVGGQITTFAYDAIGNVRYKSDVGTYTYGANGAGPHAVTSIDSSTARVRNTISGFDPRGDYVYDANGNLIAGSGRALSWTSFNKPKRINNIRYRYGPEFQRVRKIVGSGQTTYYAGKTYEKIVEGGMVTQRVHVHAGGLTIEISKTKGQNRRIRYHHKDYLGSPAVISNHAGDIVEKLSFDAWGGRRNSDWTAASGRVISSTPLGFTGHEMDDAAKLIHTGARMYDPRLGRFLSPDPTVPALADGQAFNRYSYTRNNPLSFTDPNGLSRSALKRYYTGVETANIAAANAVIGTRHNRMVFHNALAGFNRAVELKSFGVPISINAFGIRQTGLRLPNPPLLRGMDLAGAGHYSPFLPDAQKRHLNLTLRLRRQVDPNAALAKHGLSRSQFDTARPFIEAAAQARNARHQLSRGIVDVGYVVTQLAMVYFSGKVDGLVASFANGPVGGARFLAKEVMQHYVRKGVAHLADQAGVDAFVLNTALQAVSVMGNQIAGSRFVADQSFLEGVNARGPRGWLPDAADVLLEVQGIPSASAWHYMGSTVAGQPVRGFSAGALSVNNLASWGQTPQATAYSLPAGQIGAGNVRVLNGWGDPINLGPVGVITNPGSGVPVRGHDLRQYLEFDR